MGYVFWGIIGLLLTQYSLISIVKVFFPTILGFVILVIWAFLSMKD